jgi:hypothetical protein
VHPRFDFERLMAKLEWLQVVDALPSSSPLFAHDRCEKRCQRRDGSKLRAATIKHVGLSLGVRADADGTNAFPGIGRLVVTTSRSRGTVVAALRHLETVGLVTVRIRGGSLGVARDHATVYCLTAPHFDIPAAISAEEHARVVDWFHQAS